MAKPSDKIPASVSTSRFDGGAPNVSNPPVTIAPTNLIEYQDAVDAVTQEDCIPTEMPNQFWEMLLAQDKAGAEQILQTLATLQKTRILERLRAL